MVGVWHSGKSLEISSPLPLCGCQGLGSSGLVAGALTREAGSPAATLSYLNKRKGPPCTWKAGEEDC